MAVSQKLTLTQVSQSTARNESEVRIKWTSTQTGESRNLNTRTAKYWVSINGGAETLYTVKYTLPKGSTTTILNTVITVPHTAGGKGSVKVRTWMDTSISAGVVQKSASLTLDDIPRASSLTAAGGTLGVQQTLTINRAADSFKHRLTYNCGTAAGYIAGSATEFTTSTSIKWVPPIGLARQNTEGLAVSVKFTLYTYTSDGTHIGTTTTTISCAIPASVAPSCSIEWEDVSGLAGLYAGPVQGLSKLKITTKATIAQGSPIALYTIEANGAKYNAATATTEPLQNAGALKISATVKDKRGRTGGNSVTLNVWEYAKPKVTYLAVHRCNGDGTENDQGDFVEAVFSAAIAPIGGFNTARYVLRYKKSTATEWAEINFGDLDGVFTVTGRGYIFSADGNSSYDVEVTATDSHGSHTRQTSASTAFTLINWHPSGTGMRIGGVAEKENTFQVSLDTELQGPLAVLGNTHSAYVPENNANASAAGYDLMARITVDAAYAAYPLTFVFSRRWATMPMTVHFTLNNTADLDPEVVSMGFEGEDYGAYLVHAGVSVWDLYVARKSNWDLITLNTWHTAQAMDSRVTVSFPCSYASSLPGGAARITPAAARSLLDYIYPVGSIYLAYNTTSPATLFGGTWAQITARVLRAAGSADTIGSEGGLADGSGRTFVNIAAWRRTA